ncbi:hypothetical protein HU200_010634 [Digitaria exilis]|uniref:RecA family profile 1 domain-containing protein n=1 Tax=Digitaria exilis TaxID=1010633 RepID=A0A835FIQ5_9POAL|nr:hypothetical protein HU200_010634 [Digitaria exilis]
MANMPISEMHLPPHLAHLLAARRLDTAKALALLEERVRLGGGGRLATTLCGLDEALGGGIPMGKLTEVVGPSGIGKTQFCLKLALLAALPEYYGGLDGRVVYIDTESKFSSRR